MRGSRRLFRNSVALAISNGWTIVASVAFVPLMTRYLGPDGYGLYSEIYSFVMLFALLNVFGTNAILTREVARTKENASLLFGHALALRLAMNGVFIVVLLAAAVLHSFPHGVFPLLLLCTLESVLRSFANTFTAMFRAFEKMGYELLTTVVDRTLWVAGVIVVVVADLGLGAIFAVFVASALVQLVMSVVLCWRYLSRPRLSTQTAGWRFLLREGWPVGAAQWLRQASERVGVVQLAAHADSATVGFFSGANRVFQLTYTLVASISTALYPAMSAAEERTRLQRLVAIGLRALLMMTLPAAAFYMVYAPWFVPWLLGEEFHLAARALQILAPAVVLAAVNSLLSDLLRASERQRYDLLCVGCALMVNFGLNALFIPRLGYLGPALATLIAQLFQSGLAWIGARRLVGRLPWRTLGASLLATAAMVGVWRLADSLPLLLRLPMGLVVYGTALLVSGEVDRRTLRLVVGMLGWRATPVDEGGKA
jgi:O-antigen/teichoic acid export membrane protein